MNSNNLFRNYRHDNAGELKAILSVVADRNNEKVKLLKREFFNGE
jgi:hypothetical protein